MAREVLHHEAELIDAGALDAEELGAIREFVERANPEVVIVRPDDPFATPLYEGRAADAHLHLAPGRYPAVGTSDARRLVVIVGGSPFAAGSLASAAFTVSDATTDPGREPDDGRSAATTTATARPPADRTPPTHRRPQPMRQAPPAAGVDRPAAPGLEL